MRAADLAAVLMLSPNRVCLLRRRFTLLLKSTQAAGLSGAIMIEGRTATPAEQQPGLSAKRRLASEVKHISSGASGDLRRSDRQNAVPQAVLLNALDKATRAEETVVGQKAVDQEGSDEQRAQQSMLVFTIGMVIGIVRKATMSAKSRTGMHPVSSAPGWRNDQ
jgi:hypothetical protein